jgi:hypothetical protein
MMNEFEQFLAEEDENEAVVELIAATVSDAVAGFMYYDRKEDPGLPLEAIENAIQDGVITVEEIVHMFEEELDYLRQFEHKVIE